MNRIAVVARLTFHEAVRKKLVAMAFAAGAGFLLLFGVGFHFQAAGLAKQGLPVFARHQALNAFAMVGMYGIDFLIVAITCWRPSKHSPGRSGRARVRQLLPGRSRGGSCMRA